MNLPQGGNSTIETIVESPAIVQSNNSTQKEAPPSLLKSPTHVSRSQSSVVMRKKRTKKPLKRRLSIINGHLFSAQVALPAHFIHCPLSNPCFFHPSITNKHIHTHQSQTSLFTPTVGSCTNVFVSNHHSADLVIKLLLNKFKVTCFHILYYSFFFNFIIHFYCYSLFSLIYFYSYFSSLSVIFLN